MPELHALLGKRQELVQQERGQALWLQFCAQPIELHILRTSKQQSQETVTSLKHCGKTREQVSDNGMFCRIHDHARVA